jgi:phosphatidylglycerol:prolipoprotein diacylglycerol transferase
MAGCCFGAHTTMPWAFVFPPRSPASEAQFKAGELASDHLPSLPVHPTQVYESAVSLAIAAICLLVVHPRKRYDGQVFAVFVVLYAVARFGLETLRDDERGGIGVLSTSQWIGVLLVAGAALIHVVRGGARAGSSAGAGSASTH